MNKPIINNPIYTEKTECQDCYKCIRECPVKAIKVENGHAMIMPELCILCGHCCQVCPVGAKKIRNDLPRARHIVKTKKTVIASLAPSYLSEFTLSETEHMIHSLKKMGFTSVEETSQGAEIVSDRVAHELEKNNRGVILSSCCPVTVEFIQKYRPGLTKTISEVLSPLLSHCRQLKQTHGEDTAIIFFGPCIAKKREADNMPHLLDLALTFNDLREWIAEDGEACIAETVEQPDYYGKASLYPVKGGMVESIKERKALPEVHFSCIDGLGNLEAALEDIEAWEPESPVFIEMMACEGGCINGPGTSCRKKTIEKEYILGRITASRRRQQNESRTPIEYKWEAIKTEGKKHSETEIREVLGGIGKFTPEDEKNCGGCGYNTCRQFAAAWLEGKAEHAMCVTYLKKISERKAYTLLNSMPSGCVLVSADMKIIECNKPFAKLLGSDALQIYEAKPGMEGAALTRLAPFHSAFDSVLQTGEKITDHNFYMEDGRILNGCVFMIERGLVAGGIFQDITKPSVQRDKVIQQAETALQKNVETVQKIAYLLGESAAESEIMLKTIIDSFGGSEMGSLK